MELPHDEDEAGIRRHVDQLAARIAETDQPFAEASRAFETEYLNLLRAISRLGPRYAFDREGRPAAVAAVREALPIMERDLLEAIVDDHACELAAVQEALYRLMLAYGRRRSSNG
jgi:hypothetical protein